MIAPSLHPKRIVACAFLFITMVGYTQTADDSLILLSNQKLYKVNKNDGGISPYLNITNAPNLDPFSLEWSESQNCYFGIEIPLGNSIFQISETGVYTTLGPVNVPGNTISTMEGIAFNSQNNQLYVSVSLNGGPSNGDYCSESLIKVDLATMQGQIIGTFSHPTTNAIESEADAIDFDEQGTLFYFDCSVNSDSRVFKQNLNFLSPPVLICQAPYYSMADLTVKDNEVFIARGSGTYIVNKCSVNGGPLQSVNLSPSSVFNGNHLRGITWKPSDCTQQPIAAFTADTLIGNPGLTVHFSNSSQNATFFHFQFTSNLSTNTTNVNEIVFATFNVPGIYPVVLTASNGSCSDTSIIYVTILGFVDEPDPTYKNPTPANSFTPNGDGINDAFFLTFPDATSIHVQIINRWGNLVTELNGENDTWDGKVNDKPVSEGVYFFTYEIIRKDGSPENGQGFLTLMR